MKDILKEKHTQKDVNQDATFERIQCKNINFMEPLSKLWLLIQNALLSQEEEVSIELNKVKEYVEQSILLLGQATNSMTYQKRYNILSTLKCAPQQSKEILREEADLLQQQDKNLFGKKFRECRISSAKSKKQTIKLFCDKDKKKQKPFWYDPSETPKKSSGGPQKLFLKNNSSGAAGSNEVSVNLNTGAAATDKVKTNKKETLFNISFPHVIPTSELENVHPLRHRDMENTGKGFRNFRTCGGIQNTFQQ